MRDQYRSPTSQSNARQRRTVRVYRAIQKESAPASGRSDGDEHGDQTQQEPDSGLVRIDKNATVIRRIGGYAGDMGRLAKASSNTQLVPSKESDGVIQFQVSLRADQLARLWLREPSLTSDSVYAWSSKKGQWIPALSIADVATEITRARVDRMRMLTLLGAAGKSVSVLPPWQTRHQRRQLTSDPNAGGPLRLPALPAAVPATAAAAIGGRLAADSRTHYSPLVAFAEASESLWRLSRRWMANAKRYAEEALTLKSAPRRPPSRWTLIGGYAVVILLAPLGWFETQHNPGVSKSHPLGAKASQAPQSWVSVAALVPIHESREAVSNWRVLRHADPESPPRAAAARAPVEAKHNPTKPISIKLESFDPSAAGRAIDSAAARASECADGEVYGSVLVTFLPSGYVQDAKVVLFTGDAAQRTCMASRFRGVRIAPFSGGTPVMARKTFHVGAAPENYVQG